MAIQQLTVQVNESDHLSTRVFLDDEQFRLDFYITKIVDTSTLAVTTAWYFDLYDSAGDPLVLGIALASGIDLLFPYRALKVPKGKLFLQSTTNVLEDPTVDSFRDDEVLLWYQPEADVEALGVEEE